MLTLCKQFKPMVLCFSIITFLLIGYAESGEPLHEAVKRGNIDMVKRLIEEGANVDARDENNDTPLFIAVGHSHKDIAELLILKGANVNAVTKYGITPLFWADVEEHKDVMELLIGEGGRK